ncbi:MAG: hypothetical protein K1X55_09910 [Chitinophagales bacterium]|nr:hypothetical protein [Chitinophagales bacterium]
MLVNYYYPYSLSPQRLDKHLASGWFRNGNMLFTTKVLCLDGEMYNVINARLDLQHHTAYAGSLRKMYRRNFDRFQFNIQRATITEEKENLYLNHQKKFKGFVYNSIYKFLYGENVSRLPIFDTWEVNVYDGDKLVAFSYFDMGHNSLASILGIYHGDYAKYSLGLFTMMLEVEYGKKQGIKYYYPGYVLDKPSSFDYKLKLGVYDFYQDGKWKPYAQLTIEKLSGRQIIARLKDFEQVLIKENIVHEWRYYPYFSLGYFQDVAHPFVKSPIHLVLKDQSSDDRYRIVEYDVEKEQYLIQEVIECPEYDFILHKQDKTSDGFHAKQWQRVLRYENKTKDAS